MIFFHILRWCNIKSTIHPQHSSKHGVCPKLEAFARYAKVFSMNNSVTNWSIYFAGIRVKGPHTSVWIIPSKPSNLWEAHPKFNFNGPLGSTAKSNSIGPLGSTSKHQSIGPLGSTSKIQILGPLGSTSKIPNHRTSGKHVQTSIHRTSGKHVQIQIHGPLGSTSKIQSLDL